MDVENVPTQPQATEQAHAPTPAQKHAQEVVPQVPAVAPEIQHAVSLATAQLVANTQASGQLNQIAQAGPETLPRGSDRPSLSDVIELT